MTAVTQAAEYVSHLIEQGFGDYQLKFGPRWLDSLRPADTAVRVTNKK